MFPSYQQKRVVRLVLSAAALLFCALFTGCAEAPTKPQELSLGGPRIDYSSEHCWALENDCNRIYNGIIHLLNHSSSFCQQLGDVAWGRFFGDFGAYEAAPTLDVIFAVEMAETGGWSGWQPVDDRVLVGSIFTNGGFPTHAVGGILAHEELHQQGWKHGQALALGGGAVLRHTDFMQEVEWTCSTV